MAHPRAAEHAQRRGHGREDHRVPEVRFRHDQQDAHADDHDPKKPTINEGDKVLIAETKRASKDKRWRVVKVLEKASNA